MKLKKNYSEQELIIPALRAIFMHGPLSTASLIDVLITQLKPTGHDAEIIEGRNDTYFSQKVRNLKSHDTLVKHQWVTYSNGIWSITTRGVGYLLENNVVDLDTIPDSQLSGLLEQEELDNIGELIEEVPEEGIKHKRIFTTRALTGAMAEDIFKDRARKGRFKWITSDLIDKRLEGTGYDFETKEYKIEIKGIRDTHGGLQFTQKEWITAKEYREKYVLVVVKNVQTGNPTFTVIFDPYQKLSPKKVLRKIVSVAWVVDI